MGALNIYKVDDNKSQELIQALNAQLPSQDSLTINRQINGEEVAFGFTLYYARKEDPTKLSWNWLLRAFNRDEVETISSPKAVLLLEIDGEVLYAVTFGHSFFLVDKFCDRDFGFRFARKTDFREIKTSTLTTPSSHRNKTVNTYINYNELDFDSGESYAKLKANAVLPDGFTLFKTAIEVGTSIRVVSERSKAMNGEHLGPPPFGYRKNPDDPKHWLIDEDVAPVVRRIFQMAMDGYGCSAIATALWEDKVLTPSAYKISKGIGVGKKSENPYNWETSAVGAILDNPAYIGVTESLKTTRLTFKIGISRALADCRIKTCLLRLFY